MKNLIIYSIFLTILLGSGCCDILCPCDDIEDFTKATLTEDLGYDFSTGQPTSSNLSDGGIIGWCPVGQNPNYKSYDQWLWWRTSNNNTEYQKDYGNIDLNTITKTPDNWDSVINPLLTNHCYVIKCNDGYVKFKVTDTKLNEEKVEVEYKFSDTKSF